MRKRTISIAIAVLSLLLPYMSLAQGVPFKPSQGGTGTSTSPTTGDLLVGNSLKLYQILPIGTEGQCLSVVSSQIRWSTCVASSGGTGWASSTDPTSIHFTGSNNVGIGTTSPYARLSVVGPVVASHFVGTTTSASSLGGALTTGGVLTVGGNLNFSTDNVYNIGSISGNRPEIVYAGSSVVTPEIFLSNLSGGNSVLFQGPSNVVAGDPFNFVFIDSTNRVGIGTSSPGTILSIGDTGSDTINISNAATSTFGRSLNLRSGCYAVNNTCISTYNVASSTIYISASGNDSNDGLSLTTPVLTFSRARSLVGKNGTIKVMSGTYTNQYISLAGIQSINIEAVNPLNRPQIIEGQAITSWALYSGATYMASTTMAPDPTYQPGGVGSGHFVFEQGTPEMTNLNFEYRHPLFNGTTTALQNYRLKPASSLANVDTGNGRWWYSSVDQTIYIRASDGGNPNGRTIYVPNTGTSNSFVYGAQSTNETQKVRISGLDIFYGYYGLDLRNIVEYEVEDTLVYGSYLQGVLATQNEIGMENYVTVKANGDDGIAHNGDNADPATTKRGKYTSSNVLAVGNADEGLSGHYGAMETVRGGFFFANYSSGLTPFGSQLYAVDTRTASNTFAGIVSTGVAGFGTTTVLCENCTSINDDIAFFAYGSSTMQLNGGTARGYRQTNGLIYGADPNALKVFTLNGFTYSTQNDSADYSIYILSAPRRESLNVPTIFTLSTSTALTTTSNGYGNILRLNLTNNNVNEEMFQLHTPLTDYYMGYDSSANIKQQSTRSLVTIVGAGQSQLFYTGAGTLENLRLQSSGDNYFPTGNTLGIGTTTPHRPLTISNASESQLALTDGSLTSNIWELRNAGGDFFFATSSSITQATTSLPAIRVKSTGSGVGIATGTPTSLGNNIAAFHGSIFVGKKDGVTLANSTSTFEGNIRSLGVVQAGAGSTYLDNDGIHTSDGQIILSSSGDSIINGPLVLSDLETDTTIGLAGITCLDGSNHLKKLSGAGTCIVSSRRFKHDILDVENALETVLSLKSVSFAYNNDKTNSTRYGLIAEDVEKIDDRLVLYDTDKKPLTVFYEGITSLLVDAVKTIWNRLADHDGRIERLERQNADLLKRIETLEKNDVKLFEDKATSTFMSCAKRFCSDISLVGTTTLP